MFNEYNFTKTIKFLKFPSRTQIVRKSQNDIKHNIYYHSLGPENRIGVLR